MQENISCDRACETGKSGAHVHEVSGSADISRAGATAGAGAPHNHRCAGVTGAAIELTDGGHFHRMTAGTDSRDGHWHTLAVKTGRDIDAGGGKHVHPVCGQTSSAAGHRHCVSFATHAGDTPAGRRERECPCDGHTAQHAARHEITIERSGQFDLQKGLEELSCV